jgi:DNA-binding NarL/FixJ family response regulator
MVAVNLRLFGDVLTHSLQRNSGIEVVYPGPTRGAEVVKLYRRTLPDVLLLDYVLPGLDGPETTQEIRASSPTAKVLLLAGSYGPDDVERALAVGAVGFLPKSLSIDQLVEAIRQVHLQQPFVYQNQLVDLVDELRGRMRDEEELYARCASLTDRELDILRQLAEGRSTRQVATSMSMSSGTVKNYLTRIFCTIGAGSRLEAIYIARRTGLLVRQHLAKVD